MHGSQSVTNLCLAAIWKGKNPHVFGSVADTKPICKSMWWVNAMERERRSNNTYGHSSNHTSAHVCTHTTRKLVESEREREIGTKFRFSFFSLSPSHRPSSKLSVSQQPIPRTLNVYLSALPNIHHCMPQKSFSAYEWDLLYESSVSWLQCFFPPAWFFTHTYRILVVRSSSLLLDRPQGQKIFGKTRE